MTKSSGGRRTATASYIEDMLGELADLARNIDGGLLVFLIEMAKIEATSVRQGHGVGRMPGKKSREDEPLTAEQLAAMFSKNSTDKH